MSRSINRRVGGLIAAAAVASLLASCASGGGGSSGSGTEPVQDTLTIAQPWDLATPDPVIDNGLYSNNVFHGLFDQLTKVAGDGELVPSLATEWSASGDALTWTFTIRDDATFHDGTPVTPADVVFSYQAIKDNPKSLNRIYTNNIASMVSGDNTVTFTLTTADATFPRYAYYISIVPEAAYTTMGAKAFAAAPVGSGAYTFVSWTPGVSVVLEANPDYWGGKPSIKNVVIEPVADLEARLNGLLSGEIDLTALQPSQLSSIESAAGYQVMEAESNQLVYLGSNTSDEWLANADLRKAISLAVDRETIIDTIYGGLATPANASSVTSGVVGHDPDQEALKFDTEEAKNLVASSGYDGSVIPFEYATDGGVPQSNELAQAIASQLAEVGINVELAGTDTTSFNLLWTSKTLEGLYLQQFSPSMMDSATTLNYLYGPTGYALFSDPEVDALVATAGTTVDPDARLAAISDLWTLNNEENYLVNLHYTTGIYGVKDNLDWTPRADGHLDYLKASFK
jgi:peptide/nickel transport system substrate-binding protein